MPVISDVSSLAACVCRDVKLHATVLNTRHRRRTPGKQGQSQTNSDAPQHSHQSRPFDRRPFDGRWLLVNYADLDLGIQQISQVHLSQRGKYDDDGYYHALDKVALCAK